MIKIVSSIGNRRLLTTLFIELCQKTIKLQFSFLPEDIVSGYWIKVTLIKTITNEWHTQNERQTSNATAFTTGLLGKPLNSNHPTYKNLKVYWFDTLLF